MFEGHFTFSFRLVKTRSWSLSWKCLDLVNPGFEESRPEDEVDLVMDLASCRPAGDVRCWLR